MDFYDEYNALVDAGEYEKALSRLEREISEVPPEAMGGLGALPVLHTHAVELIYKEISKRSNDIVKHASFVLKSNRVDCKLEVLYILFHHYLEKGSYYRKGGFAGIAVDKKAARECYSHAMDSAVQYLELCKEVNGGKGLETVNVAFLLRNAASIYHYIGLPYIEKKLLEKSYKMMSDLAPHNEHYAKEMEKEMENMKNWIAEIGLMIIPPADKYYRRMKKIIAL